MGISDWLAPSAVLTPFWIILGYGLSLPGLGAMSRGFQITWTCAALLVCGLSWWSGANQAAHDRIMENTASDTHQIVSGMAHDLNLNASDDVRKMLKQIAGKVLPRQINPQQADAMEKILSAVPPQKFQISVTSSENETLAFAQRMAEVLIAAGWKPERDTGPTWGCQNGDSGVVVSGRLAQTRPSIASALIAAINVLNVTLNDDRNFNSCAPDNAVEVFIGKP